MDTAQGSSLRWGDWDRRRLELETAARELLNFGSWDQPFWIHFKGVGWTSAVQPPSKKRIRSWVLQFVGSKVRDSQSSSEKPRKKRNKN